MYVITHKRTIIPKLPNYAPLLVGAANHNEIQDYDMTDNTGINISKKNPNYCELTGIYWIWKNENTDVIGISHYRRFFSNRWYDNSPNFYISAKEMIGLMKAYKVVLPKPMHFSTSTLLIVDRAPNIDDIKEMYEAIKNCTPEYIQDFIWYFMQNKSNLFNMCIMRKQEYDKYCTWLFTLLDYIEAHHDIDKEPDDYRKRLFGFLSERFISIWTHHNYSNDEVGTLPVVNSEENNLTRIRHLFGNVRRETAYRLTKKIRHKKEAKLLKYVMQEYEEKNAFEKIKD